MRGGLTRTVVVMDTTATVHVLRRGGRDGRNAARSNALDIALEWFMRVETVCSRFEPHSELRRLSALVGTAVPVSPMLFEAVRFALAIAEETDGAFDPTVGRRMEKRGFDKEHRSRDPIHTQFNVPPDVTWRDVRIDPDKRTITLLRPLVLDLGAVAKGLAVDLAARELAQFGDYTVDAGGDVYVGGHRDDGKNWAVGIRHPRQDGALLDVLSLSNMAACTSGDYERRSGAGLGHIMDPRTGETAQGLASVTVIAPSAMVADGLATAAFVMGPVDGLALLERHGVHGVLVTANLERVMTASMDRYWAQPSEASTVDA